MTFTATLRTLDAASYERLRNNNLSGRTVTLQRRAPGTTSWTSVGSMPNGATVGTYVLNHSFMIPGLVATSVAVTSGLLLAKVIF